MCTPPVSAWIEEGRLLLRVRVNSDESIGFATIAMKTRQRQVIERVPSTLGKWDHMIDSEIHILPLFRGVAILTEISRPPTDLLLKSTRYFATRGQRSFALRGWSLDKIPDNTVQKTEVIVYLLIAVQFLVFFHTQS